MKKQLALSETLGMRLRTAYLSWHRRVDAMLTDFNATADQFVVLTVLAEEDGIIQQQLVTRVGSDPNTITAMLRRLQDRGLVRREPHHSDGRARCIYLTPTGKRLQIRMSQKLQALYNEINKSIRASNRLAVLGGLAQIADMLKPADLVARQHTAAPSAAYTTTTRRKHKAKAA
jgi:MarR family transcriptional regulator, organic hydroperoxide resistance regulator